MTVFFYYELIKSRIRFLVRTVLNNFYFCLFSLLKFLFRLVFVIARQHTDARY